MSDKNKPAIRFKGFDEEWEQRKLTEFVDFFSGLTYTPNDVQAYGTLVLRSSNVCNGEIVDADNVYVDSTVVNVDNVKKGDIVVVVRNGSKALLGKHAQIKRSMPNTVIGAFMTGIRSRCPEFTNALLNTPNFDEEVSMNIGATINQLTGYMFSKMIFFVPKIEEQKNVGLFFERLDNLITLHQHKYDKLVSFKKAMLDKMFPKEGCNVPEIRFKNYSDDWYMQSFKDITFLSGERNRDNLPLESYSITNERGFIPQNEQFENGGTMKSADKTMYYIVSPHSFAYNPARINVGSIGYQNLNENVIVSSLYEVFKTTDAINDRFLWHWFKSDLFQKKIEQYQEGGVRLYFYYDKLCKCSISLPCIEEQEKIGSFLDNIDDMLTLYQYKLNNLKNVKQALLDKMFV